MRSAPRAWLSPAAARRAARSGARHAGARPAVHDRAGIGDARRTAIRSAGCCCCSPARSACRSSSSRRARRSSSTGCRGPTIRPRGIPYFLYSASNLGCLLALASLSDDRRDRCSRCASRRACGRIGYAAFVVLAAGCAHRRVAASRRAGRGARPTRRARASAMRAVTTAAPRALDRARLHSVEPDARRSRATSRPTSRRCRCCGSCRWRCTSSPSRWPSAGTRRPRGAFATRALPLLVVPLRCSWSRRCSAPLTPILSLHLGAFVVLALDCHADRWRTTGPSPRASPSSTSGCRSAACSAACSTRSPRRCCSTSIVEYPLAVVAGLPLFRASASRRSRRWRPYADVRRPARRRRADRRLSDRVERARRARSRCSSRRCSIPAFLTFAQRRHAAPLRLRASPRFLAAGLRVRQRRRAACSTRRARSSASTA